MQVCWGAVWGQSLGLLFLMCVGGGGYRTVCVHFGVCAGGLGAWVAGPLRPPPQVGRPRGPQRSQLLARGRAGLAGLGWGCGAAPGQEAESSSAAAGLCFHRSPAQAAQRGRREPRPRAGSPAGRRGGESGGSGCGAERPADRAGGAPTPRAPRLLGPRPGRARRHPSAPVPRGAPSCRALRAGRTRCPGSRGALPTRRTPPPPGRPSVCAPGARRAGGRGVAERRWRPGAAGSAVRAGAGLPGAGRAPRCQPAAGLQRGRRRAGPPGRSPGTGAGLACVSHLAHRIRAALEARGARPVAHGERNRQVGVYFQKRRGGAERLRPDSARGGPAWEIAPHRGSSRHRHDLISSGSL